ncbi:hypothetical protein Hamer_G021105 [Homarus americanus]|uniref:Uncharacterized protein n=1 Tax=Homarus americanus TaxID=6706 RepID=A0A8J5JP89_HOMAM|nr:hypothetical protein Hamer_G021105 [Homarus americanus]
MMIYPSSLPLPPPPPLRRLPPLGLPIPHVDGLTCPKLCLLLLTVSLVCGRVAVVASCEPVKTGSYLTDKNIKSYH